MFRRRRRRREREKERPISTETLEREKEREKGRRGQRPRRKETPRERIQICPQLKIGHHALSLVLYPALLPHPSGWEGCARRKTPLVRFPDVEARRVCASAGEERQSDTAILSSLAPDFPPTNDDDDEKKNVIIIVIIARRKKNASQTRSPTKGHARFHPATARQTARFSLASVPRSSAGSGPRRS